MERLNKAVEGTELAEVNFIFFFLSAGTTLSLLVHLKGAVIESFLWQRHREATWFKTKEHQGELLSNAGLRWTAFERRGGVHISEWWLALLYKGYSGWLVAISSDRIDARINWALRDNSFTFNWNVRKFIDRETEQKMHGGHSLIDGSFIVSQKRWLGLNITQFYMTFQTLAWN